MATSFLPTPHLIPCGSGGFDRKTSAQEKLGFVRHLDILPDCAMCALATLDV